MATKTTGLRKAIWGIILSLLALTVWWFYFLHLRNIESANAWPCAPGTYYPSAPSYCTGVYNPGIKHDVLFGSLGILVLTLIISSILAIALYLKAIYKKPIHRSRSG
jgi:hypothetical protein